MSKQPLAKAMEWPARRSAAIASTNCSSVTIIWGSDPRGRLEQFVASDGRRAALHHDESSRVIGEAGGFAERRAGRQRKCKCRDDGVAGAGDIGHLIRTDDRNVIGVASGLEQGHATAAARDEDRLAL